MTLEKPKTDRVYVTFTDAETRKSVAVTVYGTTHDEAKNQYEGFLRSLALDAEPTDENLSTSRPENPQEIRTDSPGAAA